MSNLQHSDDQIWNNAAFVNNEDSAVNVSWSSLNSAFRLDDSSKENKAPVFSDQNGVVAVVPTGKPRQLNGDFNVNSQGKMLKSAGEGEVGKQRDVGKIDAEIDEIEKEIKRLSSRLEALRLEKLAMSVKITEKRGKVVPAKFMETKQMGAISGGNVGHRGVSLGPVEIFASTKQSGKPEITPGVSIQNRRKSCFWKLQDIDEVKAIKERGKSFSVSPKSQKMVSKIEGPKQAMTTVGSKKALKKEDWMVNSIQPKRLFKDGEKSVPPKRMMKLGRTVASRYVQSTTQHVGNSLASDGRKKSVLENNKNDKHQKNEKNDEKRVDKRITSITETGKKDVTEGQIKKKWEIPSEILVCKGDVSEEDESPPSVAKVVDALPRIRTTRCVNETPRDSGPAKRVAKLIGKKSYFCPDEEAGTSVCQTLDFAEDVEEC